MTPTGRSQIPVDILLDILDNLNKSDLATMCRLNKLCCALIQPILFRDIRIQFHESKDFDKRGFALCETLSQSPHLARCVRSFSVRIYEILMPFGAKVVETLEFLPSLRHLGLNVHNDFTGQLNGRTFSFKLESFSFYLPYDTDLRNFLNSQPSLTTVNIRFHDPRVFQNPSRLEFERKILPNLTRVTTYITDAEEIIRGRPVSEITCKGQPYNITLDFFALSTAPIQKLTIHYNVLYHRAKPGQLRALFPSLAHLTLTGCLRFSVSENHSLKEWVVSDLLPALVSLRAVSFEFSIYLNGPIYVEELLPFVKAAFEHARHLEYFAIDNGKNHCWKQVDGEWVICDEAQLPFSGPCACARAFQDWYKHYPMSCTCRY